MRKKMPTVAELVATVRSLSKQQAQDFLAALGDWPPLAELVDRREMIWANRLREAVQLGQATLDHWRAHRNRLARFVRTPRNTQRDKQFVEMFEGGMSDKEIAQHFGVKRATVTQGRRRFGKRQLELSPKK